MKVCIAEKPSVAREIAIILGAKSQKNGYYEGNGYQVSWTFGHLCTLKEPGEYNINWKYWHLNDLPMIPGRFAIKVIDDTGVQKQFDILEKLIQGADEVINCGDAGQEGEVIQRWVLHKAKCNVPIKRLWISSLTEEAIREGFENLRDGKDFDRLYAAGSSRSIGDWLLGMNATRLFTLKYGSGKNVLSVGRVQTPTLALIVNRQKEIDNFVSQTYWELKTVYREVTFSATRGRFDTKEEGVQFLDKIKADPFEVLSFERKAGKELPPQLYDLTSLQVDCNRKLNLSAEETLRIIQSLYEKKLTTYPRVDTTYLTEDIYKKIPEILKKLTPYKNFTEVLLGSKIRKSKKVFDNKKVTDHHAIIPTGVLPGSIRYEEKQVYDLVTRRFIAAFYPDCEVSHTTVLGQVTNIDFKATGKQILEPGWRVLFSKDSNAGEGTILPVFEKGESGEHIPDLAEKQTQPPKYYSEATLLRAMETAGKQVDDDELRELMKENGIGRPSTRANIIETLFRRKYIKKEKKRLVASVAGIQLIDTIENELLKSAELTGMWEKKLRDIEQGNYEVDQFMIELKQMVYNIVKDVKSRTNIKKIAAVVEEKEKSKSKKKAPVKAKELTCPKCKEGKILKGKSSWGCSNWKNGCDIRLPFEFQGKKLTDKQIEALILKKKTPKIKGFLVDGKKQNGVVVLNPSFEYSFVAEEAEVWHCPLCKDGIMMKGNSAYGCSNYKKGCHFIIPFEFLGKTLTEAQIKSLVVDRKTKLIKGFVNPETKEKVDGKLIVDNMGKIVFGKQ
ncbi:type IA DNA topoisomerase [Ancylomarina sp. 16SWW S1-10-2]|uniref:type IA DNA topoisomerase n=1 Tax=Ancylomarina sp. 16SWW S1-10-2 TaxID=2499681 RepID=UPI0012AD9A25|nr:type IA DNA topoisomerase [Ancylomarina sp. 16SWW S1-10-2]MRT92624.1 type IA DNA topoisomerase [Ancylomarina sp. 16SWW S1-10-2]